MIRFAVIVSLAALSAAAARVNSPIASYSGYRYVVPTCGTNGIKGRLMSLSIPDRVMHVEDRAFLDEAYVERAYLLAVLNAREGVNPATNGIDRTSHATWIPKGQYFGRVFGWTAMKAPTTDSSYGWGVVSATATGKAATAARGDGEMFWGLNLTSLAKVGTAMGKNFTKSSLTNCCIGGWNLRPGPYKSSEIINCYQQVASSFYHLSCCWSSPRRSCESNTVIYTSTLTTGYYGGPDEDPRETGPDTGTQTNSLKSCYSLYVNIFSQIIDVTKTRWFLFEGSESAWNPVGAGTRCTYRVVRNQSQLENTILSIHLGGPDVGSSVSGISAVIAGRAGSYTSGDVSVAEEDWGTLYVPASVEVSTNRAGMAMANVIIDRSAFFAAAQRLYDLPIFNYSDVLNRVSMAGASDPGPPSSLPSEGKRVATWGSRMKVSHSVWCVIQNVYLLLHLRPVSTHPAL